MASFKVGNLDFNLENLTTELSSDYLSIILDILNRTSQIFPLKPYHSTDWSNFEKTMIHFSSLILVLESETKINHVINFVISFISEKVKKYSASFNKTDIKSTF